MSSFRIELPLYLEYLGSFDSNKFESHKMICLEADLDTIIGVCHFSGMNHDYTLKFSHANMDSDTDVFSKVREIIKHVCYTISFQIQLQGNNLHYGTSRLVWFDRDIKIYKNHSHEDVLIEGDQLNITDHVRLGDSLAFTIEEHLRPEKLQSFFDSISQYEDHRFLMDLLYNSFAAVDLRSKYYSAFTIIEFIENKYSSSIQTHPLLLNHVLETIENRISRVLNEEKCSEHVDRIIQRFHGNFANATLESRAEKLLAILKGEFGIHQIKPVTGEIPVDIQLMKRLIGQRNKLFHAGSINEELFNDILILLKIDLQIMEKLMGKSGGA